MNHLENFNNRNDLKKYNDNALLLYSLQIKFGIEDIDSVAVESLVDGNNDKKADIVYINHDRGEAVIAQGYFSTKERKEAPANKASDLNTAVSWLLTRNIEEVPKHLKSSATELRNRINEGLVKSITLWYSHNLDESKNVKEELKTAENSLNSILKSHFPNSDIKCSSIEVGRNQLEDWYNDLTIPILVNEEIIIDNCDGFKTDGVDWESFTSSFPANLLYGLYKRNKTKLFSANVRDYLGSRKSDSNINNGIKNTALLEPSNFLVYNNGITALVNDFVFDAINRTLTVTGISIVNGAQTTGAIGSLESMPNNDIKIPVRFIKCNNPSTIASIVKYNNSQNKIDAPDFRSNDTHQKRITTEFSNLGRIDYTSRRGGSVDVISRNVNTIASITAGQVLAAFHGEPSIAYNDKSKIWESDNLYNRFFNEKTTAKHIFLCYSLVKAIEDLKMELLEKTTALLEDEEYLLSFLRSRGSIILFATAISDCMEKITNIRITNNFNLEFKKNLTLDQAKYEWRKIIDVAASFVRQLNDGLEDGIKNQEKINAARKTFTSLMSAVRTANKETFNNFSTQIKT